MSAEPSTPVSPWSHPLAQSATTKKYRLPRLLLVLGVCLCFVSIGVYYGHVQIALFTDAGRVSDIDGRVLGLLYPTALSDTTRLEGQTGVALTGTGRRAESENGGESTRETWQDEAVSTTSSVSDRTKEEPVKNCGNSKLWLGRQRYGNLPHDPLFTKELARKMILGLDHLLISEQRHTILGQSICHKDGRFRNDTAAGLAFDDNTVRLWTVRLVYYAMHYHQHRLAVPEATERYRAFGADSSCSPETLLQKQNVSVFDYECPRAKFIIMPLGGVGLGANVRGGMVPAYLMGLTADRIVLFVNNAPDGDKYLSPPWILASCPRGDYQCFFMPNSPCTLTVDEIANAYQLNGLQLRKLNQLSMNVSDAEHHRVWRFNSRFMPTEAVGHHAVAKLQQYARILVDAVPDTADNAHFIALLNKAVESIASANEKREGTYNFAARWNKVYHALTMYSMRPNPSSAAELDRIMEDIVPDDLNPEMAFGLPVRASDKCKGESECLSFAEHMVATTETWNRHLNETGGSIRPTVVFTTEAKGMAEEQKAWIRENEQSQWLFNFVTNTKDLLPDSGFMRDVGERQSGTEADPDANMLSSMSSLKLQLLPRVSIGNCCSNFHAMLNDFLSEGCGAASDNTFVCLQEYDDPLHRVCCGWHNECKARKDAYRSALLNNATAQEAWAMAYENSVFDKKTKELRPLKANVAKIERW